MAYVPMKEMLEAGVHFGHQTQRWDPKMRHYIFGARKGIHIIDLQQTVPLFHKAHDFIVDVTKNRQKVLFVGTKRQAQDVIKEEAIRSGQYFITNRWLGGTLTNFQTIRKSIDRLKKLDAMFADGSINKFTKKEIIVLDREKAKLESNLGGIKEMKHLPGAIFVIDPKREHIAILECRKLGIPVVGLVDTNCDPELVDFVIPSNDDAIRAIRLFTAAIAEGCLEGAAVSKDTQQAEQAPIAEATIPTEEVRS